MKGLSAHNIMVLGILLEGVELEIKSFLDKYVDNIIMLKSLKEKIISDESRKVEKEEDIKDSLDFAKKRLQKINFSIKEFNEILSLFEIKHSIKELNEDKICSILKNRLNQDFFKEKSIDLANNYLLINISSECKKVTHSLKELINYFKNLETFEGLEELKQEYYNDIKEAINIFSIGYGKTAVLCIGRMIEDLINKYLNLLFEKNKISKEDYDKKIILEYNDKIGFLKGNFLTEEEFTDLKSFSFKRNKGGHPNLGEIDNQRARTLIQQGIWLIIDLQKKLDELIKNG